MEAVSAQQSALSPRTYADLIGRQFKAGGRGPYHYDCYGLVREVLRRNGQEIPDYPSSGDAGRNVALILAAMEAGWQESGTIPGALILFRMDRRDGTHIGLLLGGGRFIHVMEKIAVAIERVNSPLWDRRVMGFYKWKL